MKGNYIIMICQVLILIVLGIASSIVTGLFGRALWDYYNATQIRGEVDNLNVAMAILWLTLGLIITIFCLTRLNDAWQAWRFNVYMRSVMGSDDD